MIHTRTISRCVAAVAWLFVCCLLLLSGCGMGSTAANLDPDAPQEIRPPEILTASLPLAFVGAAYNSTLLARYGTSPYTFTADAGSLPSGISLSSQGVIRGSALSMGSYSFHVTLTDSETPAKTSSATYSIAATTPLQVPPEVSIQIRRSASLTSRLLSGGTVPYRAEVLSGSLPSGLVLNADGTVTGVPDKAAPFTASIRWTDAVGQTGVLTLNVLVTAPPLVASPVAPVSVVVGQSLMQPLIVQGGTPPYSFSVSSGSLPSKVSLTAAGILQGAASTGGTYSAVVAVSDGTIPVQTITIPVTVFVNTASVKVSSDVPLRTVSAVAYGVHTSVYDHAIGDVSGVAPLLPIAGAKVLRFPGGSYSDRYHWAQHTLTPNYAPFDAGICSTFWNGYLAPNSDFGNFVRLLRASGTTGIVTVNYGSSVADAFATRSTSWSGDNNCSAPNTGGQPQEAAAWVAYANGAPGNEQAIGLDAAGYDWKTVGYWASLRAGQPLAQDDGFNFLRLGLTAPIGIRYWEIGNEIYYNGYNDILAETDLHAPFVYSSGYTNDPDSREGVMDLSPATYGYGAARFANAMRAVDSTIQVGIVVGSAIDPIPSTWTADVLHAGCSQARFDFAILHYYPGTYNAVTTDELLGNPQKDLPGIVKGLQTKAGDNCGSSSGPMPIFMTETNPNGTLASTTPDVAVALFAAHDLLTAFEAGVVNAEWLELHAGAGTFLNDAETPGPAFFGFQLAHVLADGGDQLVQATSTSGSLLVHASKQKSGKVAVMLINGSATESAFVNVQGKGALSNIVRYEYGPLTSQSGATLTAKSLGSDGIQAVSVAPLTAVVLIADEL